MHNKPLYIYINVKYVSPHGRSSAASESCWREQGFKREAQQHDCYCSHN